MGVRIIPLGGLGEVGMNAMLIEEGGRRVLVDCGVMFPNDQVLGVEVAIPDLSYVRSLRVLEAAYARSPNGATPQRSRGLRDTGLLDPGGLNAVLAQLLNVVRQLVNIFG